MKRSKVVKSFFLILTIFSLLLVAKPKKTYANGPILCLPTSGVCIDLGNGDYVMGYKIAF